MAIAVKFYRQDARLKRSSRTALARRALRARAARSVPTSARRIRRRSTAIVPVRRRTRSDASAGRQRDIPAEWWKVFGSPDIDALGAARARIEPDARRRRARALSQAEELRAARDGATPIQRVDATAGAVRQRIDPATFGFPQAPNPGPFNVFSPRRRRVVRLRHLRRHAARARGARGRGRLPGLRARRRAADARQQRRGDGDPRKRRWPRRSNSTQAILAAQRRELAIAEQRYDLGGVASWRCGTSARSSRETRVEPAAAPRAVGAGGPSASRSDGRAPRHGAGPGDSPGRPAPAGAIAAAAALRARPPAARHPGERGVAAQGERQRGRGHRRSVPEIRHLRRILVESAQPLPISSATASTSGTSASICCSRCFAAASCRRASGRPRRPTNRPGRLPSKPCCRAFKTWPTCCARSRPTSRP